MQGKIEALKVHVRQASADPSFIHHEWFVMWHLEIVERIADELLELYPDADKDLVTVMVWLHDYGKILDFENQYVTTLEAGRSKLTELGFEPAFVDQVISYIEILDKKMEVDLSQAPIEVRLVSSADGCSHFVGPFLSVWWREHSAKSIDDLLADDSRKANKDWQRKIVLPEARAAFESRYAHAMERAGDLPDKFLIS